MPALRCPTAPQAPSDGVGDGRALRGVLVDRQRGKLLQAIQPSGAKKVSDLFFEIITKCLYVQRSLIEL